MMICATSEESNDDLPYEGMSEGEKTGGGLARQLRRVSQLLHRLLAYQDSRLSQVYKNVSESVASVLTYIVMIDVALPHARPNLLPPRGRVCQSGPREAQAPSRWSRRSTTTSARRKPRRRTNAPRLSNSSRRIAPVEIDESYDEIKQDACTCLSLVSQGLLQQVVACFSALTYLHIMVFYNLFTRLSVPAEVLRIHKLVMQLLLDEQLEVRDTAGNTLGGLLQCQFIPLESSVQTQLQTLSQTRIPKAEGELASTDLVLGFSACILSSPYDVPGWKLQILMDLNDHLNDPQPIEVKERKSRSSKSFPLDPECRHQHQQCFTDDQLLVLTDLLVSPCYYA
ncbi:hypothetical protein Q5P01_023509 [Channa striata]|uniref:Proteasome activator complex subunit 4 C-terminal domain-containing protein n=1 Tax=Channa striata TaxID=64152 RepID=A0AA88LNX0_CHASR|nr:hypothetical protein Q5P01_023509 [Channa striata]